jgi:hypothetical protein
MAGLLVEHDSSLPETAPVARPDVGAIGLPSDRCGTALPRTRPAALFRICGCVSTHATEFHEGARVSCVVRH